MERTVIETQRANHAYDYVKVLEQDAWEGVDGVVSVGGDGLFNEILSSTIIRYENDFDKNYLMFFKNLIENYLMTQKYIFITFLQNTRGKWQEH